MPQLKAALFISLFLLLLPNRAIHGQNMQQGNQQVVLDFTDLERPPTTEQLDLARYVGVQGIAFPEASLFRGIDIDGFAVIMLSDLQFPLPFQLYSNANSIAQALFTTYSEFENLYPNNIAAIELFRFPYEQSHTFSSSAQQIIQLLPDDLDIPLFYRSAQTAVSAMPSGFDFKVDLIKSGKSNDDLISPYSYFTPEENFRNSLIRLNYILESKSRLENSTLFIPADWFFQALETYPEMKVVMSQYINGHRIPIPLPAHEPKPPSVNWSVLFLTLLWVSSIIHLRFNPLYGLSISRYFLNHTFFVIDVMEHRIRNTVPGIIVLSQHALLTGLFFYISAEVLVSETGLSALSHHFPHLLISGHELLSLFLMGIAVAITLQFISLAWIYISNKKMKFLSQTINLYSWPLHINFIIVTFLVVVNQRGSAEVWMLTLSVIFAIVWFMSFNVAAINGARFLDKYKILNIVLTAGLHTLIVILVIWTVIYTPDIIEPLRLAISLP